MSASDAACAAYMHPSGARGSAIVRADAGPYAGRWFVAFSHEQEHNPAAGSLILIGANAHGEYDCYALADSLPSELIPGSPCFHASFTTPWKSVLALTPPQPLSAPLYAGRGCRRLTRLDHEWMDSMQALIAVDILNAGSGDDIAADDDILNAGSGDDIAADDDITFVASFTEEELLAERFRTADIIDLT